MQQLVLVLEWSGVEAVAVNAAACSEVVYQVVYEACQCQLNGCSIRFVGLLPWATAHHAPKPAVAHSSRMKNTI
jgi:hypothetical protein